MFHKGYTSVSQNIIIIDKQEVVVRKFEMNSKQLQSKFLHSCFCCIKQQEGNKTLFH